MTHPRLIALAALALVLAPATTGPQHLDLSARPAAGQSATLLPDGRWLLLGGTSPAGPRSDAALWDPRTQLTTRLATGLSMARAWHTATVLPDGQILVVGGLGPGGRPADAVERFDPATEAFETLASPGLAPRAQHTATLLTDGRLFLAGGLGADATTAELWDPATGTVSGVTSLPTSRARHDATLLPDGRVLLWGGVDGRGGVQADGALYDPAQGTFTPALTRSAGADPLPEAPGVAASMPTDGATGISGEVVVALRFSKPLRPDTLTPTTVLLTGQAGLERVEVVPAEGGRLAFVTPAAPLAPGDYTLSLNGPVDTMGFLLPPTAVRFTVAATAGSGSPSTATPPGGGAGGSPGLGHEHHARVTPPGAPAELDDWEWKGERRDGKPYSRWQALAPLQAPSGVTALAGQVLRLNGQPLAGVTLRIGERAARTDDTGRFLLTDIPAGYPAMTMDGSTASQPGKTYGVFTVGVGIKAGQTNVLPYTIWLPLIDTQHATTIPVPTPREIVATTPRVPGLEMRIPAGVMLQNPHTPQPLTEVTLTRLPVDRTPFPLPEGTDFFFTPQTHGALVLRPDGTRNPAGVRFILPNVSNIVSAGIVDLQGYFLGRGWLTYGRGTVTGDGRQIVPEPGVQFHEVGCQWILGGGAPANGPAPGGSIKVGDPVDLGTGLFVMEKTDLVLPDVIPIVIKRTYRQGDTAFRPFGVGMSFDYQIYLAGDNATYSFADVILADGARIHYDRITPGTGHTDAVFEHTQTPTRFYKSRLAWNATRPGFDLTLADGTVYEFVSGNPGSLPVAVRDRNGNQLTITRLDVNHRRVYRLTSPSGRWVEFTYADPLNNTVVTSLTDNLGRTVSYTYDANWRLTSVTDAGGGVTEYTYDVFDRMLTVKDARGIVYLTNEYDIQAPGGRLSRQTFIDSTTYQFAYTLDGQGKVIQTDVTDPRGNLRRVTFNTAGYPLTDTRAQGTALAQTTTWTRDATSQRVTSVTDALGRRIDFTYDTMGNVLTVTHLAGTGNAVTTTFTYEPTFNQMATITDPLTHTTQFGYDAKGNLTTVTDPLQHSTTVTHNLAGQPLTITTPAGPTTLAYEMGDLASVTDPAGNMTRRFVDGGGRVQSIITPLGQRTQYEYDPLNQLRKIVDPLGGQTQFTYDPNGNLLTVADARNNAISYVYNSMDRPSTRTDPLLRPETYTYNNNGNPATFTDRKSQATSRVYDALDRLTQVTYADQSATSYTWDAGNRLTQIGDSISGTITRTYDGLDRLTQETTPQGTVSYTYDAASRRTSMTVAGQPTVTYGYDNADRLTTITQGSNVVSFAYDNADRRTALTLPNNVSTEYAYDAASRLTGLTYQHGTNTLGTLTYTYDANTQRRRIGGTWARAGLPQAVASATYNAANHQLTFGSQTLTYDLNGNLTGDGANTYTWDTRNQLATISGSNAANFGYDALGRRRQKVINGDTTTFLYDGLNTVQETTAGGVANILAGLGLDEFVMRTDGAGTSHFLSDGLGSILGITNNGGAIATEYTYEPFGAATANGAGSPNAFQFTGRENDATGVYYYRARYFNPTYQRFLSEDPLNVSGGINVFAYVNNAPTSFTDPLGLCRIDVRFKTIVPGEAYHAYIVTTSPDGSRRYYRGGPEVTDSSGIASASLTSGSLEIGKRKDSPLISRAWGRITTQFGAYRPGTPDWDPGKPPTMNIFDDGDGSCASYDQGFERSMIDIQNANVPYQPMFRNSNSTVTETLIRNGFYPDPPPVPAPGWGTPIGGMQWRVLR